MKCATLSILLMLTLIKAMAQTEPSGLQRYEVGGALGRNQYFGDMHCSSPYVSSGLNMSINAMVRRQLNPFISLRGNLVFGALSGKDVDNPAGRWDYRQMNFSTPLIELSALLEMYPLKKPVPTGSILRRFAPYAFIGLGQVYTNPALSGAADRTSPETLEKIALDAELKKRLAPVVPVGIGIAYAIRQKLAAHVEVGYRFTTSDYLDGFREAGYGYSQYKDSYLIASVGITYRLGKTKPNTGAMKTIEITPDADGDGIVDPDDNCPDEFGDPATCGCPDDDGDGVPNACDCCPNEPGERAYHGCSKAHNIEYNHIRVPVQMRYCPLCPPDQPNASRTRKEKKTTLIISR